MVPKIVEAQYRKDYRIWVRFADQVEGEVDLEGDLWGEVFESLRDKSEFKNFRLDRELETLVWPNGADFAPEFLYAKLRPNYAIKPNTKAGTA